MSISQIRRIVAQVKKGEDITDRRGGGPVKAMKGASEKKVIIIPFFASEGIIYAHYVPKWATVNAEHFVDDLRNFLKALKVRWPHKWNAGWFLHMDNVYPHTAKLTKSFIEARNITLVPHPLYSPDLASADFWLFPEAKKMLAGSNMSNMNEVKAA